MYVVRVSHIAYTSTALHSHIYTRWIRASGWGRVAVFGHVTDSQPSRFMCAHSTSRRESEIHFGTCTRGMCVCVWTRARVCICYRRRWQRQSAPVNGLYDFTVLVLRSACCTVVGLYTHTNCTTCECHTCGIVCRMPSIKLAAGD